jgi:hypothetical protein
VVLQPVNDTNAEVDNHGCYHCLCIASHSCVNKRMRSLLESNYIFGGEFLLIYNTMEVYLLIEKWERHHLVDNVLSSFFICLVFYVEDFRHFPPP